MKTLITLFLLSVTLPCLSQNHYVGISGGTVWSKASSSGTPNNLFAEAPLFIDEHRSGFHAGLTYEYKLKNNFSLGADLIYAQRGFQTDLGYVFYGSDERNGESLGEMETNFDYISLPLKAGVNVGNRLSGFANIGIVPSVLIRAERIIPSTSDSFSGTSFPERTDDITDEVSQFDLGGLVELGLDFDLFPEFSVVTSLGYQHSITTFTSDDYYPSAEARNYAVFFSFGLKYALKKGDEG